MVALQKLKGGGRSKNPLQAVRANLFQGLQGLRVWFHILRRDWTDLRPIQAFRNHLWLEDFRRCVSGVGVSMFGLRLQHMLLFLPCIAISDLGPWEGFQFVHWFVMICVRFQCLIRYLMPCDCTPCAQTCCWCWRGSTSASRAKGSGNAINQSLLPQRALSCWSKTGSGAWSPGCRFSETESGHEVIWVQKQIKAQSPVTTGWINQQNQTWAKAAQSWASRF